MRSGILGSFVGIAALVVLVPAHGVDAQSSDTESVERTTAPPMVSEPPSEAPEREAILALEVTEPAPLPSASDVDLLGAWMKYIADTTKRQRRFNGANQLVLSGLAMGLGVWAFVRSDPSTELDKGLGLSAVFLSGITTTLGILQLAKKSDSELRFERWQAARSDGMTLRELARFEGELRAQSAAAARTVRVGRWASFGIAMTGGLILGLTPAADLSSDGQTIAYALGAVTAVFGFVGFGFSFAAPSDYWGQYQQGMKPGPVGRGWSMAPAIGRGAYGARIIGRF